MYFMTNGCKSNNNKNKNSNSNTTTTATATATATSANATNTNTNTTTEKRNNICNENVVTGQEGGNSNTNGSGNNSQPVVTSTKYVYIPTTADSYGYVTNNRNRIRLVVPPETTTLVPVTSDDIAHRKYRKEKQQQQQQQKTAYRQACEDDNEVGVEEQAAEEEEEESGPLTWMNSRNNKNNKNKINSNSNLIKDIVPGTKIVNLKRAIIQRHQPQQSYKTATRTTTTLMETQKQNFIRGGGGVGVGVGVVRSSSTTETDVTTAIEFDYVDDGYAQNSNGIVYEPTNDEHHDALGGDTREASLTTTTTTTKTMAATSADDLSNLIIEEFSDELSATAVAPEPATSSGDQSDCDYLIAHDPEDLSERTAASPKLTARIVSKMQNPRPLLITAAEAAGVEATTSSGSGISSYDSDFQQQFKRYNITLAKSATPSSLAPSSLSTAAIWKAKPKLKRVDPNLPAVHFIAKPSTGTAQRLMQDELEASATLASMDTTTKSAAAIGDGNCFRFGDKLLRLKASNTAIVKTVPASSIVTSVTGISINNNANVATAANVYKNGYRPPVLKLSASSCIGSNGGIAKQLTTTTTIGKTTQQIDKIKRINEHSIGINNGIKNASIGMSLASTITSTASTTSAIRGQKKKTYWCEAFSKDNGNAEIKEPVTTNTGNGSGNAFERVSVVANVGSNITVTSTTVPAKSAPPLVIYPRSRSPVLSGHHTGSSLELGTKYHISGTEVVNVSGTTSSISNLGHQRSHRVLQITGEEAASIMSSYAASTANSKGHHNSSEVMTPVPMRTTININRNSPNPMPESSNHHQHQQSTYCKEYFEELSPIPMVSTLNGGGASHQHHQIIPRSSFAQKSYSNYDNDSLDYQNERHSIGTTTSVTTVNPARYYRRISPFRASNVIPKLNDKQRTQQYRGSRFVRVVDQQQLPQHHHNNNNFQQHHYQQSNGSSSQELTAIHDPDSDIIMYSADCGGGDDDDGLNNNSSQSPSSKPKHPTNVPYDPLKHTTNKPPCSFSSLIYMAIENSVEKALPVKEIYAWITKHFPYFMTAPSGWKNSVRHNLSLNKSFVKVEKAPNMGKGSLWRVEETQRQSLLQAIQRSPFYPSLLTDLAKIPPPSTIKADTVDNNINGTNNSNSSTVVNHKKTINSKKTNSLEDSDDDYVDVDVDAAAVYCTDYCVDDSGTIVANADEDTVDGAMHLSVTTNQQHHSRQHSSGHKENLSQSQQSLDISGENSSFPSPTMVSPQGERNSLSMATMISGESINGESFEALRLSTSNSLPDNGLANNKSGIDPYLYPTLSKKFNEYIAANADNAEMSSDYSASQLRSFNSSSNTSNSSDVSSESLQRIYGAMNDDIVALESLVRDYGVDTIDEIRAAVAIMSFRHGHGIFAGTPTNNNLSPTNSPIKCNNKTVAETIPPNCDNQKNNISKNCSEDTRQRDGVDALLSLSLFSSGSSGNKVNNNKRSYESSLEDDDDELASKIPAQMSASGTLTSLGETLQHHSGAVFGIAASTVLPQMETPAALSTESKTAPRQLKRAQLRRAKQMRTIKKICKPHWRR